MIPENIRNSIEDRTNFIDRLLIRKKAVDIVEILLFFIPIIQDKHFGLLESIWKNTIYRVERFLCLNKKHLIQIEIGDIGLKKPRSGLIQILPDCHLFNQHRKQTSREQPTIEQAQPEHLRERVEDRKRFLNRIHLRMKAQVITEIIFFFKEYFFRVESYIFCSEWKAIVQLTEKALLKNKPELKNISIAEYGLRLPKVRFVRYICNCKNCHC